MSATINIDLFANYFSDSVVIKVPGRTYKIDMEYMPIMKDTDFFKGSSRKKSTKIDPQPYIRIMSLIDKNVRFFWDFFCWF